MTLSSSVRTPVSFISCAVALGSGHLVIVKAVNRILETCRAPADLTVDGETGLESGEDLTFESYPNHTYLSMS